MAYSRVIIAEKPSMGRAIADVLKGNVEKFKTHIIVGDIAITWAFGHVYELQSADEYDASYKKWTIEPLPIVPSPFKLRPNPKALDQIKVIRGLLKETNVVIHAGDPDREGQMIVDEILSELKFKGSVKRMMLNAADAASVKSALSSIQDNGKYKPLYEAAICRSQADWLVGINLTRAVSVGLTVNNTMVIIGRVVTPTLALLVNRDNAIDNFVAKDFYKLEATVKTASGKTIILGCDPQDELRLWDKSKADALAKKLTGTKVKLSVTQKNVSQAPPKLFNVLGFSKAMYQLAKIPPKKSADILQALYEAKLTTYPRTEHEKLPAELKTQAMPVSNHLVNSDGLDEFKKVLSLMSPRDSNYTLPKEKEHHAIVPTTKPANGAFPAGCEQAYYVIGRRFLLSLLPDYQFKSTTISFSDEPYVFSKKGDVGINLDKSWRAFETTKAAEVLPDIKDGEMGDIVSVNVVAAKTTPPERYTSVSLMSDMSAVSKYVEDPKLKAILKENSGIGTAATQPAIIDKLITTGFAVEVKGSLISTDFGKEVIAKIPAQLKNAGVTALWEDALSMIASNSYEPAVFMQKIEAYTNKLIAEIKLSVNKIKLAPPPVSVPQRSKTSSAKSSHTSHKKTVSSSKKGNPTHAR